MKLNIERRAFGLGVLGLPSLAMVVRSLRLSLTGARVRYLIAVVVSLLAHWVAISLLTANIVLDGEVDRVEGTDLVVYLDSSTKSAMSPNATDESRHAVNRSPSVSVADPSHSSGLVIFSSYFSVKELDVAPAIVRDIDASSDELKKRPTDGGKVILRLWIDETGRIVRVEPLSSEMPPVYSETATRAFMRAEFHPGIKNGSFVKSKINIVLFYPAVPQPAETGDVPAAPALP